jgi:hypothetical protein
VTRGVGDRRVGLIESTSASHAQIRGRDRDLGHEYRGDRRGKPTRAAGQRPSDTRSSLGFRLDGAVASFGKCLTESEKHKPFSIGRGSPTSGLNSRHRSIKRLQLSTSTRLIWIFSLTFLRKHADNVALVSCHRGPPNDRRPARVRPPQPSRIAAHWPDQSPNGTDLLAPGRSRIVARTAQIEGVAQRRWLVLCATGVAPRARRQQESPILRGFSPRRGPGPTPKTAAPGR